VAESIPKKEWKSTEIDYNKKLKVYAATGLGYNEQAFVGEEQPVRWVRNSQFA